MIRSVSVAAVLLLATVVFALPAGGQVVPSASDVCRGFEAGTAGAVKAARLIVDTSRMWDAASCNSFVAGDRTPRREWVFSVAVLPSVLPTGVGVCAGLWTAPASDGVSVTCDRPDSPPPSELRFRTVAVERADAADRFVVATAPAVVARLEVTTKDRTLAVTGRGPSRGWPVRYFVGRMPKPSAIRSIEAIDSRGQIIGRADRIERFTADDFPSFRDGASEISGSPNVILLFERTDAFARLSLGR